MSDIFSSTTSRMSSSADYQTNGSPALRPRAVPRNNKKPDDAAKTPALDRLASDSRYARSAFTPSILLVCSTAGQQDTHDFPRSGVSTPISEDAPPSALSIATARKQARARNRLFYSIDYVPRVSHFDPKSDYHNFRGFFTLFWIVLFIMVVTTMLRNIKDTGYPLRVRVWSLLSANVWSMGISDLAMVVSSGMVLPLHKLFRSSSGWLRWTKGGIVIQSIFEAGWLVLWIK